MKIAILSDIHSNIFALEATWVDLDSEGVDFILVAGDIVGYYYWPKEVVSILQGDDRVICIQGNHEAILRECISDTARAQYFKKKYGSGYEICINKLSDSQINWLNDLPLERKVNLGGLDFYMSHGGLHSIDEYIYPTASNENLLSHYSDSAFTIFGHTHYPMIHQHNTKYLINPGSVGQPRDISGMASYLIINTESMVLQPRRIGFDILPVISAADQYDPDLKYLSQVMKR